MHQSGEMHQVHPVWNSQSGERFKIVGRTVTVRTYNGDWSKPVEAIEIAKEGDVIVIDACGGEDAVWGNSLHGPVCQKVWLVW